MEVPLLITALTLVLGLLFILLGAELFTNAVEWLGKRLNLGDSAVGSVFAALGTALPETMIPVVAILFGTGGAESQAVGVGAILGAPFMLSTLAFFVAGISKLAFGISGGGTRRTLSVNTGGMRRDLSYFLIVFSLAFLAAFINVYAVKAAIAIGLVFTYGYYVKKTIDESGESAEGHLTPLFIAKKVQEPGLPMILLQVAIALAILVGVAHVFVGALERLSHAIGISPFILTLLIAPVATELPEQFNSVLWIKHGKDTLAMGNITGAMVFQSSMIPALGILMTPWKMDFFGMTSVILALVSTFIVFLYLKYRNALSYRILLPGGALYGAFVALVVVSGGQSLF